MGKGIKKTPQGAPFAKPDKPVKKSWIECNKCKGTTFAITARQSLTEPVLSELMCLNPTCRNVIVVDQTDVGSGYSRSGHSDEQKAKDKEKQGK